MKPSWHVSRLVLKLGILNFVSLNMKSFAMPHYGFFWDHVGRALLPWYGYVYIGVPINMLSVLGFWAQ